MTVRTLPSSEQLAALLAVVDEGTFEAAARRLSITPSAVSQRIRALESTAGQVLVVRSTPCAPTDAGTVLLRMARQQRLLADEALAELNGADAGRADLPIAVNADSLATWFVPALAEFAAWDVDLRLHVEDQDHSAVLLRRAAVLGAVTSDPVAVGGCSVERLGVMRYVPAATPELVERHSRGRRIDWSALPVVRFNAKDDLQHRLLARHDVTNPPTHLVPSSQGFLAAVRAGLGWGMLPLDQLDDEFASGQLVRLGARAHADVTLHWQCWRLDSDLVLRTSRAVRKAARALRA
ncbi:LysR family transcriptional regulator ArgP [Propionibacteriaceae bacterium Y1700]|uniref:LysR family transcriptional regulator ArgP n=1 Tax=Microlunatus sp. Y1700 TaxID=3418487 RepID=UPI003DA79488